ncbi:MAG: hypothetical protein FJX06_08820 [Alphaproteobacteria bacterium]|nr:hypothetical protein [Alphaproteobacteria bacterium]
MIYWLWAVVAAAEASYALKAIGGSNYVSYGHMADYLDTLAFDPKLGQLRFDLSKLRPVIATYHRDPASVRQQLPHWPKNHIFPFMVRRRQARRSQRRVLFLSCNV